MATKQVKFRRWSRDKRADWHIPRREIQAFVDQVVEKIHPLKVILFGSYAYGKPNADSDVDLLVVMPHRGLSAPRVATRISLACPRNFSMDLLIRSPAEIRRRIQMGDCFIEEITSKGIVLHEADHARMG
jgi:predicted nucleotidyltransferase